MENWKGAKVSPLQLPAHARISLQMAMMMNDMHDDDDDLKHRRCRDFSVFLQSGEYIPYIFHQIYIILLWMDMKHHYNIMHTIRMSPESRLGRSACHLLPPPLAVDVEGRRAVVLLRSAGSLVPPLPAAPPAKAISSSVMTTRAATTRARAALGAWWLLLLWLLVRLICCCCNCSAAAEARRASRSQPMRISRMRSGGGALPSTD